MGTILPQVGLLVSLDADMNHSGIITKIVGSEVWIDNEKSIYSLHRWRVI